MRLTWNPWRELERWQGQMTRLFGDGRRFLTRELPRVNVSRDEDSAILAAELPGVDPEQLDITVTRDSVSIRAERQVEELGEGQSWHRRERGREPFARTVELPFEVDPDSAEARFERGILTLRLHRPEELKPKKVAVKAV